MKSAKTQRQNENHGKEQEELFTKKKTNAFGWRRDIGLCRVHENCDWNKVKRKREKKYDWILNHANEFYCGERQVLLCISNEPHARWRKTFNECINIIKCVLSMTREEMRHRHMWVLALVRSRMHANDAAKKKSQKQTTINWNILTMSFALVLVGWLAQLPNRRLNTSLRIKRTHNRRQTENRERERKKK